MREVHAANSQEDYRRMEKLLDEVISEFGKALHFLFLRAESRLLQEKYYEAIADLGSLLKEAPHEIEPLYMRAVAYYQLAEYDAVNVHIKEIMKYDPDHEGARALNKKISNFRKLLKRARQLVKDKKLDEATQVFIQATEVDTDHLEQVLSVYSEICEAHIELKVLENAADYCEPAISEKHANQLSTCLKYSQFHLDRCDDDQCFEFNLRLWKKCEEADEGQQNRDIRNGMEQNQRLHKRFRDKDRDYYGILGLPRDASSSEIRKKYRKLAKELHPDRFVGESEEKQKKAEKNFHRVAQAYEILSDEELRSKYDRGEDVENPNAPRQQHQGFHGFPFQFKRGGQSFSFSF